MTWLRREVLAAATALAALAWGPGAADAQLPRRTLDFQGGTRVWFEYVPSSYDGAKPVPLVVALHGGGGNGQLFAGSSGWAEVAEVAGFIVVLPNAGQGNVWNTYYRQGADDVGWLLALIARIRKDYNIDPARVFMTGHSNGASMTNTFAGRHAELLTATAPVSGAWITTFGLPEKLLTPSVPLPVWVWRGERENFTTGLLPRNVQDQQQKQFWVRHNGAYPEPAVYGYGDGRYWYTTEFFYGGGTPVWFTEVAGQSHAYRAEYSIQIWYAFFGQF